MNYSMIVIILALLVAITNVIVQVIKDLTGIDNVPTKRVTTLVAIVLTVASYCMYCQVSNTAITWYSLFASIVTGFIVSYGSIFGFDNLYGDFLDKLKDVIERKED